jgi:tetratricopeptide (TPR) repeat protein
MDGSGRLRWYAGVACVLAVASGLTSLGNGFALDDVHIIQNNTAVHALDLGTLWGGPYWPKGEALGLYRPLTTTLFAVQWAAGDGNPFVFHATSVLLHAVATLLVFLLLARLLPRTTAGSYGALAGASVFAVHPVHVEAVANVVGQAELLAAIALLAACAVWIGRDPDAAVSPRGIAAVAVLYIVGMLSKEHAIVLPALLVAVDAASGRWRGANTGAYARGTAAAFGVLAAAALSYLVIRHLVLGSITAENPNPGLAYLQGDLRIWNALRAWPEYFRLMFFPLDLSADYAPAVIPVARGFSPEVAVGLLLLTTTSVVALAVSRTGIVGLAAAWFLIVILPVSNLLFPIGVLVAERTLYLPSVALGLIAAAGVVHVIGSAEGATTRTRQAATAFGVVIVCSLLLTRSFIRAPVWDSTETVHRSLIQDHPESYRAQWALGSRALAAGDREQAARHYDFAYRIHPDDPKFLLDYANQFLRAGDLATGLAHLQHARRLDPLSVPARTTSAYIFNRIGQPDSALALYTELRGAVKGDIELEIARALEGLGRHAEAARAWADGARSARSAPWLYHAHAARAAARAGDEITARQEIAAAMLTAQVDSNAVELVSEVARALETGCYDDTGGCASDPLANRDG